MAAGVPVISSEFQVMGRKKGEKEKGKKSSFLDESVLLKKISQTST